MSIRSSGVKRIAKRWARRTVAAIGRATSFASGARNASGVRILTYHRVIHDKVDPFAVSPSSFSDQLQVLAKLNVVRALDDALQFLSTLASSESAVVLTFDDGTLDFLENAWPILDRFGFPATIFVNPSRVGTAGFIGWSDLRELSRRGVQVGSHGLEHRSLGNLGKDELRRQLVESRKVLEEKLEIPVRAFAYPYGTLRDFNQVTHDEVRSAGYLTACTSLNGLNTAGADILELHRTKIEHGDDPIFAWILAGCLDRWEWIDRHFSTFQNRYAGLP